MSVYAIVVPHGCATYIIEDQVFSNGDTGMKEVVDAEITRWAKLGHRVVYQSSFGSAKKWYLYNTLLDKIAQVVSANSLEENSAFFGPKYGGMPVTRVYRYEPGILAYEVLLAECE